MDTQSYVQVNTPELIATCDATRNLLKPMRFNEWDRLYVSLTPDGKSFLCKADAEPDESGYKHYLSNAAYHGWKRRAPEWRDMHGEVMLAGTDISALVLTHVWPKEQVYFTPEAKIMTEFLILRFMRQSNSAHDRARYLIADKEMRKWYTQEYIDKWKFVDGLEHPLATYQKIGAYTSIGQEAFGGLMEQGTGKTPMTIGRMMNEVIRSRRKRKNKSLYRVIIVAPKNVRTNWKAEFQKFSTTTGKVTILHGNQLDRVKQMVDAIKNGDPELEWTAVICSYETLQRSWEAIGLCEWDLGVLDESHYIKSPQAKRAKAAIQLRDRCKSRVILTGTPYTNSILDLYMQLEFLGEGLSGFSSWKAFQRFYLSFIRAGNYNFFRGYQNLPILQERLSRLCYIVKKEDALPDLPRKLNDIYEVTLGEEQRKIYIELANKLAVECKNDMDGAGANKSLVLNNVLTKMLRLAQVTSGYVVWDPVYDFDMAGEPILVRDKIIDRFDPDPRLEGLVEILKSSEELNPFGKTIIWTCWVQNIKTIRARLELEFGKKFCVTYFGGTSDEDREIAVNRFNGDPECKVFIGNPAAGGTGLNLLGYNHWDPPEKHNHYNADHVIYYSQNWSMTARSQSEDRAHRRGTRVPVRYTDMVTPNTIDEEIRKRVVLKRETAMTIQDVEDVMREVLSTMPVSGD